MSRPLLFHWHRLAEWLRDALAQHAFARGRRHFDRARRHGAEADRICPPPGPNGRAPAEGPAPEWDPRFTARHDERDPAHRPN